MKAERLQEDADRPLGRSSRRAFLGQVGGVTAAALSATVVGAAPLGAAGGSVAAGGAAAGRAAGGPVGPALQVFQGERHMLDELTQETFARHLHSTFRVYQQAGPSVDLTLAEAVHTPHHAPEQGLESFSLMFEGPPDMALPQDTYTMEHEHLGQLELFIVPVGLDTKGRYYECVFNRLARG